MSFTNERYESGIPSAGLTNANANKYVAVRVDPDVEGGLGDPAIPVTRTGSADNALEVFAEYLNYTSPNRVRIKTGGILTLQSDIAYTEAVNGQGVRATTTAGVVEASGAVGVGLGRIVGGGQIDGVNVYKVYVA